MVTKIAIFSDIHANLPAMETVAAHIGQGSYDGIYCLGDIGGYASEPNETQAVIQAMDCPTVRGNYDDGVGNNGNDCGCHYIKPFDIKMSEVSFQWTRQHTTDTNKAWLRELPREIRLDVAGKRVLLCHGSPRSTTEYLFENRSEGFLKQFTAGGKDDASADVIVFGHTHVPYQRTVDGVTFINTGSVGRPKDNDPRAGYCVVTFDEGTVTSEQVRLPYDVGAACERLLAADLPEYFADRLRIGGDVDPADYDESGRRRGAQLNVLMRRYLAEFIGTFTIVFAPVALSASGKLPGGDGSLAAASWVSGLAVLAMIYTLGPICSAHFNPAVTLGFVVAGRFPRRHMLPYIAAQFLGGIAAAAVVYALFGGTGFGTHIPGSDLAFRAFGMEIVLTFFLMLVILAVATNKSVAAPIPALAIGLIVVMNVWIGGPVSGGSMNPARSLGPALLSGGAALGNLWIYLLAPCVGSLLAAFVYEKGLRVSSSNACAAFPEE